MILTNIDGRSLLFTLIKFHELFLAHFVNDFSSPSSSVAGSLWLDGE